MVAPPFIHDEAAEWDHARLENRLTALQSWVWGANTALATYVSPYAHEFRLIKDRAAAALLGLTSVASSPFPQSLLILSGLFSFFGLIYTVLVALSIGDRKTEFFHGFRVSPPSPASFVCTNHITRGCQKN